MGRTLVIGDIHGCFDELRALLDAAALTTEDRVVALGDLIDRGPRNAAVVDFFRTHPQATSIRGNHEQKHILSRRGHLRPSLSQMIARRELGEDAHADMCAWMDTLPLYRQLPGALLVHGFLEPGVPLDAQRPQVLMGTMSGERHLQQSLHRPWYETAQHATPIIVGHRDYLRSGQPFTYRDRVFGLDTSVYAGKRLTGLIVPDFRFVSVPARADHWTQVRSHNADLRYAQAPIESLTWLKAREILSAYRQHPPSSEQHRRRQQRISAMLHAAERIRDEILTEITALAALPATERDAVLTHHPQRALANRLLHGHRCNKSTIEGFFKKPAHALCAERAL